jgi:peptidoglycan hydrolase CwlO-like protein
MPSATLKTKTTKAKRTSPKSPSPSSVRASSKTSTKSAAPSKEVEALQGQLKNLTSDIDKLESKVDTLVSVLYKQLNDHMRHGPEGLAREIKKAKLLD